MRLQSFMLYLLDCISVTLVSLTLGSFLFVVPTSIVALTP